MKAIGGGKFLEILRSPHTHPHVTRSVHIGLHPHQFGGYVLRVSATTAQEDCIDGLASHEDLIELSEMFAAAAQVLASRRARMPS